MIPLKTDGDLKLMREANRIIAVVLTEIEALIKPGVSTGELDRWAEARIRGLKGEPGFLGYGGGGRRRPYPATLCTSINEEVVHGIPSMSRKLQEGDIIGIDVGARYQGFHGDGARTYAVGEISSQARALMDACQDSLDRGVAAALVGNRVSDISIAIDHEVRARGFEIIRDLSGHGVGRDLHEDPQILNYIDGTKGEKLRARMTLAIEPMITNGSWRVRTLEDHWTVVTADGSLSAHFEHTVAVTDHGPEVLTRL